MRGEKHGLHCKRVLSYNHLRGYNHLQGKHTSQSAHNYNCLLRVQHSTRLAIYTISAKMHLNQLHLCGRETMCSLGMHCLPKPKLYCVGSVNSLTAMVTGMTQYKTQASSSSTTKAVQSTALSFEGINHIKGCDSFAAGVLGVGYCIPDDVLQKHLQNARQQ